MLKKLFYRLMLFALVGMLVAPLVMKRYDGTPIMTVEDFLKFDVKNVKNAYNLVLTKLSDVFGSSSNSILPGQDVTRFYKWQDENGEWHFSDTKPDNHISEQVEIDNERNVLKFDDLPQDTSNAQAFEHEVERLKGGQETNKGLNGGGGYINRMTNTLEDARNVQSQVDADFERKAQAIDNH